MPNNYLKKFYFRDYVYITFGLIAYAFGLIGFIKPVGIVTGGLMGIGLTVEYATNGLIPVQITYFSINCLLCVIAFKILGGKFLAKTIYSIIVLTILLSFFSKYIPPIIKNEPLMSAIIGAMFCGAGIGFVFNSNGSTGGTDIVVAIVNKYKNLAFGRIMLFCDFIIIAMSFFVLKDWVKVIHGMLVMGVTTYVVDMVINGMRQNVQIFIISNKYAEIANAINSELHRGCTLLEGMGWYTQQPTKVLMVMTKRTESVQMFRLIKSIDEHAFISQSVVRGVYGKGFDMIKGK